MSRVAAGPLEGFDAAACIDRLAAETARAIRDLGRRGAVVGPRAAWTRGHGRAVRPRTRARSRRPLRMPKRDIGDES